MSAAKKRIVIPREIPQKKLPENRKIGPTIRLTEDEREAIIEAATIHGYEHYTEFIRDVVLSAIAKPKGETK